VLVLYSQVDVVLSVIHNEMIVVSSKKVNYLYIRKYYF
jgi:hypothetical protein